MGKVVTCYHYEGEFDEDMVERILVDAKNRGVVTGYDIGRGNIVWFSGHPGGELGKVRKQIKALLHEVKRGDHT